MAIPLHGDVKWSLCPRTLLHIERCTRFTPHVMCTLLAFQEERAVAEANLVLMAEQAARAEEVRHTTPHH